MAFREASGASSTRTGRLIHERVVMDESERNGHRQPWARHDDERCEAAVGEHVRCMLVTGHDGLHWWKSPLGERTFEWG